ncbi:MAG: pseudaminic acid synthase [Planctomycetota bacterium]
MTQLNSHFEINGRRIGPHEPTYIIAELSANHHQDFDRAVELIHQAHRAGADAVKLQTYTAETLTLDSDQPCFQIDQGTVWDGKRLFALYQEAATPWEWHHELKSIANQLGMDLFSSPFDRTAVDFLDQKIDVPAFKIASFEIVDIPLLKHVATKGKPVIISTGMATVEEIELAVTTLRDHGCRDVAVLKCVSAYPAPQEAMNLKTIPDLAFRFRVPVGLSDHTIGPESATLSVALGGSIIEKHLTLSREEPGPDSSFSSTPVEFAQMVSSVRQAESCLGQVFYGPTEYDKQNIAFRRSLFAVKDIAAGEKLTHENVRSIRPGQGLPPKHLDEVIDREASESIPRGTPLKWRHVA